MEFPASHSQYSNPVIDSDFPDPNCIKVADTFYVFATNFGELKATTSHIQLATSSNLVQWQTQPDALPTLPRWAKEGRTWAPNVTEVKSQDGTTYVLYFVAWEASTDRQAIGVATSKNPEGPYEPTSSQPIMFQVKRNAMLCACYAEA